ncbi:MAG: NAD(P)H-dependent oxidoreductase subunit E [Deltaproteobacteria bacterium]|nr:NAD(P)H-dependent oxidoreductase subunit E [Deltaproteobacteria bacterium]
MGIEEKDIRDWAAGCFYGAAGANCVQALLALQDRFGYLPKIGMHEVARRLGITRAAVYGVATFYNQFRFTPPGRHAIKVCTGTACHIKQATKVLEHWERRLDLKTGGVTGDREYSLDRVACVGCCVMAPVTVIGEVVIGEMSPTKVDGILLRHRLAREKERSQAGTGEGGATENAEGAEE